jgi:hypothetical protein
MYFKANEEDVELGTYTVTFDSDGNEGTDLRTIMAARQQFIDNFIKIDVKEVDET